jgi:hypothetical protein
MTTVSLTRPQIRFLRLAHKYRMFCGGFGSGKTFVGCCSLISHFAKWPGIKAGYFAPTYGVIRDVFYQTMEEVAFLHGWIPVTREGNREVDLYRGGAYMGTVICRSMENPGKIIGYKIGAALVDELDTLKTDKAKWAWRMIIARLRYQIPMLPNQISVTTTPEGFRFCYDRFVRNGGALYGMIQASTYENEINLNPDYIDSLLESYPPELVAAYLEGQFVNMRSGTVYHSFDRFLNGAPGVYPEEKEPLFVGMDFNVGEMSAVIHVIRPTYCIIEGRQVIKTPFAVGEIRNAYDTPAMIETLQETYPEHHMTIYPDASGGSRKTVNASKSDIKLLKQAGFKVKARKKNPFIKDRITSMNAAFNNAKGFRNYRVNVEACPGYVECLEQQAFDDNGVPDKKQGLDHLPDGAGYFIEREFGLTRTRSQLTEL